jgi:hypothetical protein
MIELNDLLKELDYADSPNYHETGRPVHLETAHLLRAAREAGVRGVYVFRTAPRGKNQLSPRPLVYIAEARDLEQTRRIHKNVWNLGYAPFLIVLLPNQLRLYTGFNYSPTHPGKKEPGLLGQADNLQRLVGLLSDFKASAIDSGLVWKSRYYKGLDQGERVDKRLLLNLQRLGETLENDGVPKEIGHALIGKYVYLNYLRSRGILKMLNGELDETSIFSLKASVHSLKRSVEILEDRLNGKVFPIDFSQLKDQHVSWVASVFGGSEVMQSAPPSVHQLHLPFQAYDFRYIPVETLSSIYEQFIHDRKEKGAIYTPEILADYLLSEMESFKPLTRGMKVLDPACGSGVFLVLAYRRLIEKEIQHIGSDGRLRPELLRQILEESIFGIERERDACYVAEFSLILTLLSYTDSTHLKSTEFRFPPLHNTQIMEADFFNTANVSRVLSEQSRQGFDWIVGNPPWTELKPASQGAEFARAWINNLDNRREFPVTGNRVAEAFSWRVTQLLGSNGLAGLVLPATSLFNIESEKYRRSFFTKNDVLKITNFANMREVLFGREKSGVLPAMTVIYRPSLTSGQKRDIIHFAPFFVNQVFPTKDKTSKPWVITINEDEIKTILSSEAENGDMVLWKLALWGRYLDRRTLEIIKHMFPATLEEFCRNRGWGNNMPCQGAELRKERENARWPKAEIEHVRAFRTEIFNAIKPRPRFSLTHSEVLEEIKGDRFIRWGQDILYHTTPAPHLILSKAWQNFAIYSEEDFVVPPQQLVVAAPKGDEEVLRALTVYLSSSLVAYYLFFHVPEWGVFRQRKSVITSEARRIPTPEFTSHQISQLAAFHREVVAMESRITRVLPDRFKRSEELPDGIGSGSWIMQMAEGQELESHRPIAEEGKLQTKTDELIYSLFEIPEHIRLTIDEFVGIRLAQDRASGRGLLTRPPTPEEYLLYAQQLRTELDTFVMDNARHRVRITYSDEIVECMVEVTEHGDTVPVKPDDISSGNARIAEMMKALSSGLREQIGDWVNVQRGLRLYDGPSVYIYKTPRLIDWTRSQAIEDAADIIGDMVKNTYQGGHEENQTREEIF